MASRPATNTSISLGPHFKQFIRGQVSSGRFGSASEVIRAGLRMLEEQEARLASLRSALEEGEASGFSDRYTIDRVLSQAKRPAK
jgi:antitoxin ParD1/3/4